MLAEKQGLEVSKQKDIEDKKQVDQSQLSASTNNPLVLKQQLKASEMAIKLLQEQLDRLHRERRDTVWNKIFTFFAERTFRAALRYTASTIISNSIPPAPNMKAIEAPKMPTKVDLNAAAKAKRAKERADKEAAKKTEDEANLRRKKQEFLEDFLVLIYDSEKRSQLNNNYAGAEVLRLEFDDAKIKATLPTEEMFEGIVQDAIANRFSQAMTELKANYQRRAIEKALDVLLQKKMINLSGVEGGFLEKAQAAFMQLQKFNRDVLGLLEHNQAKSTSSQKRETLANSMMREAAENKTDSEPAKRLASALEAFAAEALKAKLSKISAVTEIEVTEKDFRADIATLETYAVNALNAKITKINRALEIPVVKGDFKANAAALEAYAMSDVRDKLSKISGILGIEVKVEDFRVNSKRLKKALNSHYPDATNKIEALLAELGDQDIAAKYNAQEKLVEGVAQSLGELRQASNDPSLLLRDVQRELSSIYENSRAAKTFNSPFTKENLEGASNELGVAIQDLDRKLRDRRIVDREKLRADGQIKAATKNLLNEVKAEMREFDLPITLMSLDTIAAPAAVVELTNLASPSEPKPSDVVASVEKALEIAPIEEAPAVTAAPTEQLAAPAPAAQVEVAPKVSQGIFARLFGFGGKGAGQSK